MASDRNVLTIRQPSRYVLRMLGFLALVSLIIWLIREPLLDAISANPPLNIGIIAVLGLGVLYTFGQILSLRPEIKWLNKFRMSDPGGRPLRRPVLLRSMARLFGDDPQGVRLTPSLTRSILDSIGSRLDESRDISRYLVGLLIFLGLLGTFWGLLQTVSAVGDTIRSLSVGVGPIEDSFEELRSGLEAPLDGMGTAFSSSLIGLAGSLILGFLDIQMTQAQNRFYNDIEEWLSESTQLQGGFASMEYAGGPNLSGDIGSDPERLIAAAFDDLSRRLSLLTKHMQTEQEVMLSIAESQAKLMPILERLADPEQQSLQNQYTEAIYGHLRNLDASVQRLIQDGGAGGDANLSNLKKEIMRLTQAIQSLSQGS
ncbi:MAG: flagellar motor protein MotA [Alphaproteobacteria bacterium]|nr:MAG: flagellar motor protein MotA [Alphaproteobacteria bacterium]